jgi:hypothetical protein
MSEPTTETQEGQELRSAQARVDQARQARAIAENAKLAALKLEIEEKRAAREREIFNEKETARLLRVIICRTGRCRAFLLRIQEKWRKKHKDEEDARAPEDSR